ncbi:hypothetical protein B0T09DRAFT_156681 [Sordaria sp. MPI-SDFR-AT-0083]|nr:hypothetical protein B0T09DRAFT_156681 [Sordaria sp. MPI-SDFR-AT-0083]
MSWKLTFALLSWGRVGVNCFPRPAIPISMAFASKVPSSNIIQVNITDISPVTLSSFTFFTNHQSSSSPRHSSPSASLLLTTTPSRPLYRSTRAYSPREQPVYPSPRLFPPPRLFSSSTRTHPQIY